MSVMVRQVKTKDDLKEFIDLPYRIYKNEVNWVPLIRRDEMKALLPKYNPAFEFCDAGFWLAELNGKVVGRIGGIINHRYNEKTVGKLARFTRPEFFSEIEIAKKLFDIVEEWGKNKGMLGIHGPLGFTNLDHQGLLIEGFDYLPCVASEYHLPYYKNYIESFGYTKEIDWVEFRLTIEDIPEKAKRLSEAIKQRYELKVLRFKNRNEIKPYARQIFDLLNESFAELFSVVNFDNDLRDHYVSRYLDLLNPEFIVLILNKKNELMGFI